MTWLQRIWSLIFGPPPAPVPPPVPTPMPDTGDGAALAAYRHVNAGRVAAGLAPLQWSELLGGIANRWAQHMASAGLISHAGFSDRLSSAGYKTGGECVAVAPTAEAAVVNWMASPLHRVILMQPRYTDCGVGAAKGEDGRIYWCLLAGRREG